MDLEGTLLRKEYHLDNGKVAPSAWTLLAEHLGESCLREEEETKDKWLRGMYVGYVEWMRDTIRIHKKYGLTADLFYKVMNSVELMPGAKETVHEFRTKGATTAIITGGFKALADRVQKELKIDHAMSGCEYFFDDVTGEIEHFNLLPSDEEGKVDFMHLIVKEHAVQKENCVFIGDGKNDIYLAEQVGFSIAFNAQDELKRVATITIDHPPGKEDFREVAIAIGKYFGE
jgi:phosphoserine phosphatase